MRTNYYSKFDAYKAKYDKEHSASASVPLGANANVPQPSSNSEYAKDRMRAIIELRRQKEQNLPKDIREELTRYESDCVTEDVVDILKWWKVLFTFSPHLLYNIDCLK